MNPTRIAVLILAMVAALPAQQQQRPSAAGSLSAQLNYLRENAARQRPDPAPTVLSQADINAYLAGGAVKLPSGVESLAVALHAQQIIGSAKIDFDKVRTAGSDNNPFLSMFSGVHEVVVDAFAEGTDGKALIRVNSASLDGIVLPRFALELFVSKYVTPKHPNIGLDTRFTMPERISTAMVSEGRVTLVQRKSDTGRQTPDGIF
ncbi:MAG: hypothetical protein ABI383_15205 [Acidobacteriaceae bacterium]